MRRIVLIVRWQRDERILQVVVAPHVFAALARDPAHEALIWLRRYVAPRRAHLVRITNERTPTETIEIMIRPRPAAPHPPVPVRGAGEPRPVPPAGVYPAS